MRSTLVFVAAFGLASCAIFQSSIHKRETLAGKLKRLGKSLRNVTSLQARMYHKLDEFLWFRHMSHVRRP